MTELRECMERLASSDEAERIYAAEDIGYPDPPGAGDLHHDVFA
jgi:hypothetical protein